MEPSGPLRPAEVSRPMTSLGQRANEPLGVRRPAEVSKANEKLESVGQ